MGLATSGSVIFLGNRLLEALRQQAQTSLPSALDQIPYVLAIMVFAFFFQREHRADRKEERESWQLFLKEQREQHGDALARIAEEVKTASIKSSETLSRVTAVLDAHDRRAEHFIADQARQMNEATARLEAVHALTAEIEANTRPE